MNKFPERLKELRKTRKINQQALSKHLNYGYTAVANYESGRNQPSIDTLIQIADFFGVSVDYLLGISDDFMQDKEMSENEKKILAQYRRLSDRERLVFEGLLDILSN